MIGSACAPSTSFSLLCPSSPSPERERARRFIVSNYLLVDRDKRVTRMYASGFHEKSRVTRGVPRPRKGKTAWVCAEETDVVTVYVLSRILRACGSCSCDTPDRYMYYKYARVPMNGPRVEVVTCEASTSTSRFYSSINDSWLILTRFLTFASCFDILSVVFGLFFFFFFGGTKNFSEILKLTGVSDLCKFTTFFLNSDFLKLRGFGTWIIIFHDSTTIRRRLIPTIFP